MATKRTVTNHIILTDPKPQRKRGGKKKRGCK